MSIHSRGHRILEMSRFYNKNKNDGTAREARNIYKRFNDSVNDSVAAKKEKRNIDKDSVFNLKTGKTHYNYITNVYLISFL